MRKTTAAVIAVSMAMATAAFGGNGAAQDPVVSALDTMIQDEYRAEAELRRAARDLRAAAPFPAMAESRRGLAELIGTLYRDRGLPVPASRWSADRLPARRTLADACAAAAATAQRNHELYDRYLAGELPSDVKHVFRHNRNVSKHEHLPELRKCGGAGAVTELEGDTAPARPAPAPRDRTRVRAPRLISPD